MDRMNTKELNAISGALWHTVYDNWATAARCYDARMDDLGDYYASTLPAIQSAYAKLMGYPGDPTPVDEMPVTVNTCGGNHTFGKCDRDECDYIGAPQHWQYRED